MKVNWYECIGLDDNNFNVWTMYFSIGEEYEQVKVGKDEKRFTQVEDRILLKDNSGTKWWVPKDQFKKVIR